MHSADLGVHLKGEIPKVIFKNFGGFFTVDIKCEKLSVQLFIDNEQQLTNFKNNFLWAFKKPLDHR